MVFFMKLTLFPSVNDVEREYISGKDVVVIDVLRATSVISTAVNNGAVVIPVLEVEDALKFKQEGYLLGGERKGLKIEGFDFGNSPLEYTKEKVEGKKIVFTTSNGTKAIHKAFSANKIIMGSMINAKAVAKTILEDNNDISIICAGTYGKLSLDDFICAGKIIYEILKLEEYEMDDVAMAAYIAYRDYMGRTLDYVKHAKHYNYLLSIGGKEDIEYCFKEDIMDVAPIYRDGEIKNAY